MQRVESIRAEALHLSIHRFAARWSTPVLLLQQVVEGDLSHDGGGPEGTMRHSLRRTLKDRLGAPAPPGRRRVAVERIALMRRNPDQPIEPSYLIGRDKGCDVLLNDYTISSNHARIHHIPHIRRWMVEDLASTNLTHLNGGVLPPHERGLLTSLDELQLGRMVFLYLEPTDLYRYLRGDY